MTALAPATAARLEALADRLDEEALGSLPFASGELAEALAQGNAVRALAGPAGGGAGGSLTFEECVVACRNVGIDLTCGGCASAFYTGHAESHDEGCRTAPAGAGGAGAGQCEWTPEDYEGAGDWNTSCGQAFRLDEGGPVENGMNFCYGYGLPLVEVPWSDSEEPEEAEAEPPSPVPQRAPRPAEVYDLMAALKASLAAGGKAGG